MRKYNFSIIVSILITLITFNSLYLFQSKNPTSPEISGWGNVNLQKETIKEGVMHKEIIKITILYDNYVFKEGTSSEWGFSCLIEGMEKVILFDTGTRSDILQHNIEQLNIDITKVDEIVLSHQHQDHTGGLWAVLEKNPNVTVHIPESFSSSFKQKVHETGALVAPHNAPDSICKAAYLTGEMGNRIPEQAMILESDSGLVVITGCSHPGIVEILKQVKTLKEEEIYLVVGGFHLMNHSDSEVKQIIEVFKQLGVKKAAPTHCTGDRAIDLFREAYGNRFLWAGTGKVFNI
jgi:7,8-dihydropterin-6-yl-methyl-4-(beta-D-ribofuranosyl)aminobenzene 5'-phosphate synthase